MNRLIDELKNALELFAEDAGMTQTEYDRWVSGLLRPIPSASDSKELRTIKLLKLANKIDRFKSSCATLVYILRNAFGVLVSRALDEADEYEETIDLTHITQDSMSLKEFIADDPMTQRLLKSLEENRDPQ